MPTTEWVLMGNVNGNHNAQVFDGTGDFLVWQAHVENELLRRGLLGYVLVESYNGSQSFNYRGDCMPAKCPEGLGRLDAVKEAAEALHIVQCSLHAIIESAILYRNVFDTWSALSAMFGSGMKTSTCNISEMYRVQTHMWYGDKKGESMEEYATRWGMTMNQLTQATGSQVTDSYRSANFEQSLPRKWRSTVSKWRGTRPYVPFAELVEKAIAEEKRVSSSNSTEAIENGRPRSARELSSVRTAPRSAREPSSARIVRNGSTCCFYCFIETHTFKQCKVLEQDIETGRTHNNRSSYSCQVTGKRTVSMVKALEAYVAEEAKRTAHRPSVPRGDRKRDREIDLTQEERQFNRGSKSRAPPPRLAPQRSRSLHPSAGRRRPPRAPRSRSVVRNGRSARSPSSFRGDPKFFFPPRNRHRSPSFERLLPSSW